MNRTPVVAALKSYRLVTLLLKLIRDPLFALLLFGLLALGAISPARISSYTTLVDWPTIAALTGLLVLTKGLEASGAMQRAAYGMLSHLQTEREIAIFLVLAAALLSTVLTNDIALFIVVPLTLGICNIAGIAATRFVVFEALAVNVGSMLTPVGNPQNLFLWQNFHLSFGAFCLQMLPLVLPLLAMLLLLTVLTFSRRLLSLDGAKVRLPLNRSLLGLSLALYLPFLIAANLQHSVWALAAVLLLFFLQHRKVMVQVDWGLIIIFILMFIDLRLLAGLETTYRIVHAFGIDQPNHLYLAGIAVSQVISNVPATIALVEYSHHWKVIAYAVNVGGFGFMVASLANLIALRLSGDRRGWLIFHVYALPFLGFATMVGYFLLFSLQS